MMVWTFFTNKQWKLQNKLSILNNFLSSILADSWSSLFYLLLLVPEFPNITCVCVSSLLLYCTPKHIAVPGQSSAYLPSHTAAAWPSQLPGTLSVVECLPLLAPFLGSKGTAGDNSALPAARWGPWAGRRDQELGRSSSAGGWLCSWIG